jgi:hypothetical protein
MVTVSSNFSQVWDDVVTTAKFFLSCAGLVFCAGVAGYNMNVLSKSWISPKLDGPIPQK